jgi:hypothetical protein
MCQPVLKELGGIGPWERRRLCSGEPDPFLDVVGGNTAAIGSVQDVQACEIQRWSLLEPKPRQDTFEKLDC